MKLTEENTAFYAGVFSVAHRIPHGHVTSYGHIAYVLGKPGNSRQVGTALKHFPYLIDQLNQQSEVKIERDVPWWRVVLSAGKISPRENSSSVIEQANILRREGVEVLDKYFVNFEDNGWFPEDVDY